MNSDPHLRWQVRLRSRADLEMVKELTGVLAALSGSTHGQIIAEAVKTYAAARMGGQAVRVLEELAVNVRHGSATAVESDSVNMSSTCPS